MLCFGCSQTPKWFIYFKSRKTAQFRNIPQKLLTNDVHLAEGLNIMPFSKIIGLSIENVYKLLHLFWMFESCHNPQSKSHMKTVDGKSLYHVQYAIIVFFAHDALRLAKVQFDAVCKTAINSVLYVIQKRAVQKTDYYI